MRIRRFTAPEMRTAIRIVRDELGAEAVILSNRKVEGGIEIVAAVDYDDEQLGDPPGPQPTVAPAPPAASTAPGTGVVALEQELRAMRDLLEHQLCGLAWGEFGRRQPVRAGLLRKLLRVGITKSISGPLAAEAQRAAASAPSGGRTIELAWRRALGLLAARIPVTDDDILSTGGVVALLGPTGVGKTTSVAKLAARFRMRHGPESVALLTTDNYRVGAQEQLRTFGHLMNAPVAVCTGAGELRDAIARYEHRRLVLIDTAGMSQRDVRLAEQAALVRSNAPGPPRRLRCYLVLSAATEYRGLDETVRAYRGLAFDGALVTKMDEATSLGGVISCLIGHRLPVAYVCAGQRVPEDLAPARAHDLVSQAVAFAREPAERAEETMELAFGGFAVHA